MKLKTIGLWKIILVGLLCPIFVFLFINWYNRPKVVVYPQMLLIRFSPEMDCCISLEYKICNNGNSPISIKGLDLELYFPHLDKRPFLVENEVQIRLEADDIIDTTVNNEFKGFKQFDYTFKTYEEASRFDLDHLYLVVLDLSGNKKFRQAFSNKDIELKGVTGFVPEGQCWDSSFTTNDFLEIADSLRSLYIDYKGHSYQNLYYPPDVEVSYEVDGDSIFLNLERHGTSQLIGRDTFKVEDPFNDWRFFPHPALREQIYMPRKLGMSLDVLLKSSKLLKTKSLDIEFPANNVNFLYVFRNTD
jgi:hypothetical protein